VGSSCIMAENLSPIVVRRVLAELKEMQQSPPEDIRLLPLGDSLNEIQAAIVGPAGTPYEGGEFRVTLKLGSEFPQVPPKGFFVTKIFHPNVSKAGEICVNTLKKDWKPEMGIKHVLLTVKCLLIVPNPESALNEEAGRLLLENYEDYAKTARLMTSIHAQPEAKAPTLAEEAPADAPTISATDKKSSTQQKKRALKRL